MSLTMYKLSHLTLYYIAKDVDVEEEEEEKSDVMLKVNVELLDNLNMIFL